MKIFANDISVFELSVLFRFIYRSGLIRHVDKIFVNNVNYWYKIPIYSRTPTSIVKKYIVEDIPIFDNAVVITTDELEKSTKTIIDIRDVPINKDTNIIIDKKGEYVDSFPVIKTIYTNNLGYKAIYTLYKLLRSKQDEIPSLNNVVDKTSLYIAKKILIAIDYDKIDIIKLWYVLQHVYKNTKKVIELYKYLFRENEQIIVFKLYDDKLNYIKDIKVTLKDFILKVPIIRGNKEEIREFYIDLNKRRVYILNNFYIDYEKENSENLVELLKYL